MALKLYSLVALACCFAGCSTPTHTDPAKISWGAMLSGRTERILDDRQIEADQKKVKIKELESSIADKEARIQKLSRRIYSLRESRSKTNSLSSKIDQRVDELLDDLKGLVTKFEMKVGELSEVPKQEDVDEVILLNREHLLLEKTIEELLNASSVMAEDPRVE